MTRKDTIIKHFKMMGYETIENEGSRMCEVRLYTKKGYGCQVRLQDDDFHKDFVIEHTVRRLNELIIRDL